MMVFALNGLAYEYLWPNSPAMANQAIPLSIALAQMAMHQFTRKFLDLRQRWRLGDVLSRLYPSIIVLRLSDDDAVTCDFEAMSQSSAFRNDLADNSFRHEAYVEDVVVGQQDLRRELHALLDGELGIIDHESASVQK
jgi:hypothetical protein